MALLAPRGVHGARRGRVAQAQVVRVGAAGDAREAPVHDVDLAELADHHVGGLQVAVHDALGVRVGHRFAHAQQHVERARAVPALLRVAHELEDAPEIAALDEAHREVDLAAAVEAELVHGHDAGVIELAGDLRLLEEAHHAALVDALQRVVLGVPLAAEHDLHRELAAQIVVPHAQDHAHAAARELAAQLVARALRALRDDAPQELARRRRGGLERGGRGFRRAGEHVASRGAAQREHALELRVQLAQRRPMLAMRGAEGVDVCRSSQTQELDEQRVDVGLGHRARSYS